jgi:hypothetical protein
MTSADPATHDDNVLMAEVCTLNAQLGRYVLRFLDTDAQRADPISPQAERALAGRVAQVADGMLARAIQRELASDPAQLIQQSSSNERP